MELPEPQVAALQEQANRLLGSRKAGTELRVLARDMLVALIEACTYAGLDNLLAELPADLADHEPTRDALIAKLEAADVDGRGPRNEKPRKVVEAVLAALGLTVVPAREPAATLDGALRVAAAAAIAKVLERALDAETMRDAIVADARGRVEDSSFNKIVKDLDDRGMQMTRQPKVPLESMQTVSRALAEARVAVISKAVNEAIDRAKEAIGETGARFEQPVTAVLTPRAIAVQRAYETPLIKTPVNLATIVLASLAETARIAWREPEVVVHPYAASKTFAVGDVVEHPKFGRGTVVTVATQRIDVEFPTGKSTLVHAKR